METTLALKDGNVFPSHKVLKKTLAGSFSAYESWCEKLFELGVDPEWRYYNDGKAWLCKLMRGKKNLGWLSVYAEFFAVVCYFTEKHFEAIVASQIPEAIKEEFYQAKPSGKLIPMRIKVTDEGQVADAITMLQFKMRLK